jgi:hypothetical protein
MRTGQASRPKQAMRTNRTFAANCAATLASAHSNFGGTCQTKKVCGSTGRGLAGVRDDVLYSSDAHSSCSTVSYIDPPCDAMSIVRASTFKEEGRSLYFYDYDNRISYWNTRPTAQALYPMAVATECVTYPSRMMPHGNFVRYGSVADQIGHPIDGSFLVSSSIRSGHGSAWSGQGHRHSPR